MFQSHDEKSPRGEEIEGELGKGGRKLLFGSQGLFIFLQCKTKGLLLPSPGIYETSKEKSVC